MLLYYIAFELQIIGHISATKGPMVMGFGPKCSTLNGQVTYIEVFKLNFADMWLISLDHVTNMFPTLTINVIAGFR